ncbi:hypothetical protein [Roseomonas marmotae]|uniref:Uncharacterized protein n=1 Tax=Roseomonas marmotae TaxID=2768161 RepID=A0ABS3K8K9_9PROT|nr:hypothetical protein [Roseomonas marmotae]MBO1073795.1 hypothetical protein [Roseomonas marmotae]QTI78575.1 hypothetical protein IAI58_12945 [Roseomonas marmotae]
MIEECWVRVYAGQAACLMHYEGDVAIVYLAGEEMTMEKSAWASLPPYRAMAPLPWMAEAVPA